MKTILDGRENLEDVEWSLLEPWWLLIDYKCSSSELMSMTEGLLLKIIRVFLKSIVYYQGCQQVLTSLFAIEVSEK